MNNTTVVSQMANTQDAEEGKTKEKDKSGVSLVAYKPFFRYVGYENQFET